jgi:hypothetical protein
MWRFWSGACFAIVLLEAFAPPLLLVNYAAGSELYSCILLAPFHQQTPARYLSSALAAAK